jgi:hypothetical protein
MDSIINWGSHFEKEKGGIIASSKIEYYWNLSIDKKGHTIVLAHSKTFSGKVRLWFNNDLLVTVKKYYPVMN